MAHFTVSRGNRPLVARSCSLCGKLKMATEFFISNKASQCKRCVINGVNKINKTHNENSQANATRKGEPWTQREINELEKMIRNNLTARQAAERLRRTYSSIRNIMSIEGILARDNHTYSATLGSEIDMGFIRHYIQENV